MIYHIKTANGRVVSALTLKGYYLKLLHFNYMQTFLLFLKKKKMHRWSREKVIKEGLTVTILLTMHLKKVFKYNESCAIDVSVESTYMKHAPCIVAL